MENPPVRVIEVRVIKVGGSLLQWPLLPARLRALLAQPPDADPHDAPRPGAIPRPDFSLANVLIAGGGAVADCVRSYHRAHQLDESVSHELALDSLSLNARLLLALLPEARILNRPLPETSGLFVADPAPFMRRQAARLPGALPPETWETTSDTIAARMAVYFHAETLLLLKSIDASGSLEELARSGVVDPQFPKFASSLRVQLLNLRRADPS